MKDCPGVSMPCEDGCVKAAYAYVPPQDVSRFYDYQSGFVAKTIFPELAIPKGNYGPKENLI